MNDDHSHDQEIPHWREYIISVLAPLFGFLGLPPWWYLIPFLSALGLGGTVSAYFITPYRWGFYVLAGLFAVLGFYFNVIRQRKPVNVTVYLVSMFILGYVFVEL